MIAELVGMGFDARTSSSSVRHPWRRRRALRGLVPGPAAACTASVRRGLRFVWIATRQSAGARAAAATAAAAAAARTRNHGAATLKEAGGALVRPAARDRGGHEPLRPRASPHNLDARGRCG